MHRMRVSVTVRVGDTSRHLSAGDPVDLTASVGAGALTLKDCLRPDLVEVVDDVETPAPVGAEE